ncbi:MAG: threonine ammonia-lyase IlvA [Rhodobacteraceae bacterium]|nr:threonine ammonia-lyase IlvA [Paracoccaceae bacterium]
MTNNDLAAFRLGVDRAAQQLRSLFDPTPLQRNDFLSARYGADIYLKREDLSPVRSYKIRGAFNAVVHAINSGAKGPFVCASAGNHAQGVAYVCKHFNVRGVIFMPVTTPQQKVFKTRSFGAGNVEIRLEGDYFDDTLKAAQEYSRKENAVFLPPFDDDQVIEGQATVAAEIMAQLPDDVQPDMVVMPVGGGGLAAGLTQYMQGKSIDFRFVEPVGAPSLYAALKAGELVTLPKVDSFVDGAAVNRIGARNFKALKGFAVNDCITVAEGRLCTTMIEMLNVEGIVLEPAGALAIDALKDIPKADIAGKSVVVIVSGGNFDFERLPDVKERALRFEGLKKYFILRMPQRPGALKDFLNLLGPQDDIARFEYLKKSARNFGSVLIGIETREPGGFEQLFQRITDAGFSYEDITDNDTLANFIV